MNVTSNSVIDFELDVTCSDSEMAYSDRQPSMLSGHLSSRDEPRQDCEATGSAAANVNAVTVVMADASLVPPTFSGASGSDADAWIRRFCNYCDFRRLDGDDRLPLFRLLLVDAAADWVQGLPAQVADDFEAVQTAFQERFVTNAASKTANVAALWSRKQQSGETAEDFINATKRLASKIPVTDEALICHAAIQGLRDDTKRFVMLRGAETLEQVITAARLAEATAILTPAQGDKAVLQELSDLKRMFGRLIATAAPDKATVMNNITAAHSTPEGPQPTVAAATQAANPPYTVQYVMSAPQQSGGRHGQRGRGRGARGRGWSPRWNPYHGQPVMTTPYGFIPPYTAPLVQPPTAPQQTMMDTPAPFQFSPTAQTFQPQAGGQGSATASTTSGQSFPAYAASNTTASAPTASAMSAWVLCDFCGRQHNNRPCVAASSRCFRCSSVGHYARCCTAVNPAQ